MSDATSTIKLGVDTSGALASLKELTTAFDAMKANMTNMSSSGTDGLARNLQGAAGSTANFSTELQAALNKVTALEAQMKRLTAEQVSGASLTADAVKKSEEAKTRAASEGARERVRIAAQGAAEEEAVAAKYRMGMSAKVGGTSFSMGQSAEAAQVQKAILDDLLAKQAAIILRKENLEKEAESAHRAAMLESALKDEEVIQRLVAEQQAYMAKKAAAERETEAVHRSLMLESALKDEEIIQGMLRAHQVVQDQRVRSEREAEAVHRALMMESALKDEETIQGMLKAQQELMARRAMIEREAQAQHITLMIESAAKDAEHAAAAIALAEKIAYEKLMIEAQFENRVRDLRAKAAADAERTRLATVVKDNNYNTSSLPSQIRSTTQAKGLVDAGEAALAKEMYGPAAVANIRNLTAMTERHAETVARAGAATRGMAGSQEQLNGMMREGHSLARGLAGPLGAMWLTWGSIIPLLTGAAIATAVKGVVESGKELEYQLTFVSALTDGATISQHQFADSMRGSQMTTKEGAQGLRALAQAGLEAQQAISVLPKVLNLATVGEMSVGAAALSATGVMHAFNLEVSDIGRIGDVFAKAAAISNTSVQSMTDSMKTASVVSDMYHVSLEETSASLVVLAKRNIVGTSAGTSLRNMISEMAAPISRGAERIKQLGLEFYDAEGRLKPFSEQLVELRKKTIALNEQSRIAAFKDMFGERGIKSASALMKDAELYEQTMDQLKNKTTGFVDSVTQALNGTVEGQLKRTANELSLSFDAAFEKTGDGWSNLVSRLTGVVSSKEFISFVTEVSGGFIKLVKVGMEYADVIALTAGGLVALNTALGANTAIQGYITAQKALQAATLGTVAATEAATAATGAFRVMVSTIAWPVAIITALGAAYYYLKGGIDAAAEAEERRNNNSKTIIEALQRDTQAKIDEANKLRAMNETGMSEEKARSKVLRDTSMAEIEAAKASVDAANAKVAAARKADNSTLYTDPGKREDLRVALNKQEEANKRLRDAQSRHVGQMNALRTNEIATEAAEREQAGRKVLKDSAEIIRELQAKKKAGVKGTDPIEADLTKLAEKSRGSKDKVIDIESAKANLKELEELRKRANGLGTALPTPDRNAAKNAQAQDRSALEEYRNSERMARDLYESEVRLANMSYKAKLTSTTEYLLERNAAQDKYDKAAADAQATAEKKVNAIPIPAGREDLKKAFKTDLDKIGNELREKKARDDMNESEKIAADRVKQLGEAYSFKNDRLREMLDTQSRSEAAELEAYKNSFMSQEDQAVARARAEAAEEYERNNDLLTQEINLLQEKLRVARELYEVTSSSPDRDRIKQGMDSDSEVLEATKANRVSNNGQKRIAMDKAGISAKQINDMKKFTDALSLSVSLTGKMESAFGRVGTAIGGVTTALLDQAAKRQGAELAYQQAKKENDPDAELKRNQANFNAQVEGYANLAGAAKNFFSEKTAAYKALQVVEDTYRTVEIASQFAIMAKKIFFKQTEVGAITALNAVKITGETATTGASMALAGSEASAWGLTAVVKAIASLPFPMNLVAGAATLAAVVALGAKVTGGLSGGGAKADPAKKSQEYAGTGYTWSSNEANNPYAWELTKSESLEKSLDALNEKGDIALEHSSGMLKLTRSINDGISGMANTIAGTAGLRGTKADERMLGVTSSKGALGFNKSSVELVDQGIFFSQIANSNVNKDHPYLSPQMISQTIGSVLDKGVVAEKYSDMNSKSSSWWGLSKSNTPYTVKEGLDGSLSQQMSLTISGMYDMVLKGAKGLGLGGTAAEQALKNMSLQGSGLDRISLKGLTADEVEKQLLAVFGKLGDDMAKVASPGLDGFMKAGEGYLTTMVRVSSGTEAATYALQQLGVTAVQYAAITDKRGDVATEMIRDSLAAKEGITGVSAMLKDFSGTADDLVDTYKDLSAIRQSMKNFGVGENLTRDVVKGAGGVDNLKSGVKTFQQEFYTEAEQASMKAKDLSLEFTKLGVVMPTTKDAFRKMVEGIDQSTSSGQNLFGVLMNLAGGFAEIADKTDGVSPELKAIRINIEKLSDSAQDWLDTLNTSRGLMRDLDEAISGTQSSSAARIQQLWGLMGADVTIDQKLELAGELKDLILDKYRIEQENAKDLIKFGKDLRAYVQDLKTGDLSPLTTGQKLAEAAKQYQDTLAKSKGTGTEAEDARDALQGKGDAYLELAKTYFASGDGYRAVFDNVTTTLDALGVKQQAAGDSMTTTAQQQLDSLKDLRGVVSKLNDTAEKEYNKHSMLLSEQITLLGSISDKLGIVSDVPNVLKALPAELAAAMSSGVQITGFYQSLLGRAPDAEGYKNWMGRANSGVSLSTIRDGFLNSDEYKDRVKSGAYPRPQDHWMPDGSHFNGLSYVPFDGYMAELHRGERVLTAAENDNFGSNMQAALLAEIRELKQEVTRLRGDQVEQTGHLIQSNFEATEEAAEKVVEGTRDSMDNSAWKQKQMATYE